MADYIDREAALADFDKCNHENSKWTPQRVKTLLMRIPSADEEPIRPVGKWVDKPSGTYGRRQSWCTVCGKRSGIGGIESNRHKPHCPNCGAKWIWRIIMAHDFLGNELSIGDDVVFLNYNVTSASLERGKITKVSEHTADISGKRRAEYKIVKVNPVKSTMGNTWIPCSERPPEESGCYLVAVKRWYDGKPITREAVWNGADWISCEKWIRMEITPRVTHWMPLPEPPEEVLP